MKILSEDPPRIMTSYVSHVDLQGTYEYVKYIITQYLVHVLFYRALHYGKVNLKYFFQLSPHQLASSQRVLVNLIEINFWAL